MVILLDLDEEAINPAIARPLSVLNEPQKPIFQSVLAGEEVDSIHDVEDTYSDVSGFAAALCCYP